MPHSLLRTRFVGAVCLFLAVGSIAGLARHQVLATNLGTLQEDDDIGGEACPAVATPGTEATPATPMDATPAAAASPDATPAAECPPDQAGTANRPPECPAGPLVVTWQTDYAIVMGSPVVSGVTAEIDPGGPATDPDADALTYSWSASNGTIRGNGPTANWEREVHESGNVVPGTVTMTVTDDRGASTDCTITFS